MKTPAAKIRIVRLEDPAEYLKTEKVQRDAWGIGRQESIIPFHTLIAAQHHSGLVLGAYDGNRMIGCSFGISAWDEKRKRAYHYSHITAVLRKYQKRGVGLLLKKAQREYLTRQNIDLVKWTFDPLQAGNAYFNIRKLGAIVREYHRNLYGKMPDSLNRGMISDRFEAEWWINGRRVRESLQNSTSHSHPSNVLNEALPIVSDTRLDNGLRIPVRTSLEHHDEKILFEIPSNIGRIKSKELHVARRWTTQVRKSFEHYFGRRYAVTDVLVDGRPRDNRVYYLLERSRTNSSWSN